MVLDIIIIVLLISALIRGREIGFIQQAFSTVGFFGGLLIGAAIEPLTVKLAHTHLSRSLVTLLTTLGLAIIFLSIGEYIGVSLKRKVSAIQLNKYDNILGSLLSVVSVLIGVWLAAAILRTMPFISLQQDIKSSKIVSALDRHLPPAPNIVAGLGHLVDPNGFPKVFNGNEPAPPGSISLPPFSQIAEAASNDRVSVVKIAGEGCGGIVEGSGFVVSSGEVATNAHVVAGIIHPYVQDQSGNHLASVIYFNPNLDFALLRVSDLADPPLSISNSIAANATPGAVLGYPGGGGFTASSAEVLDEFTAIGSNIYAQGSTDREVYEVEANIIPGNSGGPLINTKGVVIGVVFAESTEYNNVGYALVTTPIVSIIEHTNPSGPVVGSGSCAE